MLNRYRPSSCKVTLQALPAILVALGALCIASQSASAQAQSGEPKAQPGAPDRKVAVRATEVRFSPPRERIQSLGTGKAVHDVKVTTDVAGTVESIHFLPNEPIEKGAPLITLNREAQNIALSTARANYEKESASLKRYTQLARQSTGFVSQIQLDEARASFAVAEAALASARYEFDRRIIRAPFAGRVDLTDLSTGSYLPQGAAIVTVTDASRLLIEFNIPENVSAAVKRGLPVRAVTPALVGRPFRGVVTAFDNSINAQTRTIRVRAEIENPDQTLLPGMTFQVQIEPVTPPLPVVPALAITWSRDGASVWSLDEDDNPHAVPVLIRRRDGDNVWIEGNLQKGDRVVTDGALKVRSGAAVRVLADNDPRGQ